MALAESLFREASDLRQKDFAGSAQRYLQAARIQLDAVRAGQPRAGFDDLKWYLASYCSVKAGHAFVSGNYGEAVPFYLAFFGLAQEADCVWPRIQRLVNPMASYYFAIAGKRLNEPVPQNLGRSPAAQVALRIHNHANPQVGAGWEDLMRRLACVNLGMVRMTFRELTGLAGPVTQVGDPARVEHTRAFLADLIAHCQDAPAGRHARARRWKHSNHEEPKKQRFTKPVSTSVSRSLWYRGVIEPISCEKGAAMDFVLTEEQQMFQKLFRDFATKEVAKVAEQTDKKEEFPAKLIKRAAGQGFLGVFAPEEPYGGAGLDFTTYTLLVEAMAAECASTALTLHVHNVLALRTLVKHGTELAKEDLVPEMVSGDRIGAFALTESGAGSDPTRLRTVACKEDGHWVITGNKTWVSNAGVAGVYIVFAATDPSGRGEGHQRLCRPGRDRGRGAGRPREDAGPARGADSPAVPEGCARAARLPAGPGGRRLQDRDGDARLRPGGHLGRGSRRRAEGGRARHRVRHAAQPVRRRASRPSKRSRCTWPMPRPQVQAGQWLVRHAAWLADQGQPFTQEAAMAKLYCGRMAGEVTNKMLQVHGGAGFIADYPIERYYRDARAMELVEGTSQMQQIVIAGGLLGPAGIKVRP